MNFFRKLSDFSEESSFGTTGSTVNETNLHMFEKKEKEEEEEEDAVFKIFSSEYQFHPLLGIIFSYLRTEFILNTICLVSSHFKNIASELSVFSYMTVRKESFSDPSDPANKHLFQRFCDQVLRKRYRTKSLSISDSIFMSYVLDFLYGPHNEKISIPEKPSKKSKKKKKKKNKETELLYDLKSFEYIESFRARIKNLSKFERLFSKIQKLEILDSRLSRNYSPIKIQDVVTFLNSIPHLQHFIVHHIHLTSTKNVESFLNLKEHTSLRILQLRCNEYLFRRYSSTPKLIKAIEYVAAEFMAKCPNLYIFELPYFKPHFPTHSVFYDDLMHPIRQNTSQPPPAKQSTLKTYLRNRFLENNKYGRKEYTFEFRKKLSIFTTHKDYFPVFFGAPLNVRELENGKKFAEAERRNYFLIQGVPFRFHLKCFDDSVYLSVQCPFVQYFCTSKLSNKKFLLRRTPLDLQRMFRVFESKRYGGGIGVRHFICSHDGLSELDKCGVGKRRFEISSHFLGRNHIPLNLTVEKLFTLEEYKELKSEDSIRRTDYEKLQEEIEEKEERIMDICWKQQGLYKTEDSVEFIMDIDEYSKKLGACTRNFSIFGDNKDLLDFQFQLRLDPNRKDRGVYFNVESPVEEIFIPLSYHLRLTILEFESEEHEDEDSSTIQKVYEFTSFLKYRTKEYGMFGFDFSILNNDNDHNNSSYNVRNILEKRVKVEISMSVMDYVLSSTQYILKHQRYYESTRMFKFPIEETKKLVLYIPQYGVASQTGIHKILSCNHQTLEEEEEEQISKIDPRLRTIRLCGIDFTVEFQNGPFQSHNNQFSRIWFNRGLLETREKTLKSAGSELKMEGLFTVKVLSGSRNDFDNNKNVDVVVIKEVKQKMFDGAETCINVCEGDRNRKLWSFLVTLKLDSVNWVKE